MNPPPVLPFSGKRILVTGAGSGIGRATAKTLAAAGAKVMLVGRHAEELKTVYEELGGMETEHLMEVADVSLEETMTSVYESVAQAWGGLDGVVANAGINGVWAPLDRISGEEWDTTLTINLKGTFLTVKLALPLLRGQPGAAVVVVASINGTRIFSNTGATAYACSKAAQVAFVKMTALELARDGIRVNAVCPGAIATNIGDSMEQRDLHGLRLPVIFPEGGVPLTGGPEGSPERVADVISFLLSDAAAHVTGTELYADGGQSLLQG